MRRRRADGVLSPTDRPAGRASTVRYGWDLLFDRTAGPPCGPLSRPASLASSAQARRRRARRSARTRP